MFLREISVVISNVTSVFLYFSVCHDGRLELCDGESIKHRGWSLDGVRTSISVPSVHQACIGHSEEELSLFVLQVDGVRVVPV